LGLRTEIVWWRRGTAALAGVLCVAGLIAVILLATSFGGSGGGYTVRAIFDDAGNLISGEDVKIDGVKVGTVGAVTPTPQAKAAVTLHIENPGFQDFRTDASCTIKPQALIGEKYVDCLPTQARPYGTPLPPALSTIPGGREGAGERLLPVTNTSSPVDLDLLGDITRLPERQRLAIIINELGAGLAGRGSDLNAVIRRADPALRELTKVLGILASENKRLARLAVDSDQALAPITRDRERVADFIVQSNTVSKATALHRGALAQNLEKLPTFLKELKPALHSLGQFAEQTTPVFTDLGIAAPGINQAFEQLGPFSKSSTKFFKSLGTTSQTTGPALVASRAFFKSFQTIGAAAKPFSTNAASLLSSVRETGGIERLVDTIFNTAGATNGYDALGHFLRGEVVVNNFCLNYAVAETTGCSGRFRANEASAKTAAAGGGASGSTDIVMARTLAVLNGATPAQAIAEYPGSTTTSALGSGPSTSTSTLTAQPVGGSSAGTTYYNPSSESSGTSGLLLNYLLGE
jgi:virulence factor Mce-like protein